MTTIPFLPRDYPIDYEFHLSMRQLADASQLDTGKLSWAVKLAGKNLDLTTRNQIEITDGSKTALWNVPSLRELFRGNAVPPSFQYQPPADYQPLFYFVEHKMVHFCRQFGDKTDNEFEEAYGNLRRRPDGKTLSELHFFLWQTAALLLGITPLSPAQFDAIFGRLRRSARTFSSGIVSRNYIDLLQNTFRPNS